MSIEKGPEFRVVGNAPEDGKEYVKKEMLGRLHEQHLESLGPEKKDAIKQLQYEKSPKELALIGLANESTNALMEEIGVAPFNVPENNFHILPPDLYKEFFGSSTDAVASSPDQAIFY
jgi:uncharacterized protein YejL (UPF0352 family)